MIDLTVMVAGLQSLRAGSPSAQDIKHKTIAPAVFDGTEPSLMP